MHCVLLQDQVPGRACWMALMGGFNGAEFETTFQLEMYVYTWQL